MTRALFGGIYRRTNKIWMVCDCMDRNQSPCVFDEETALRRGDPPRCIRHGALLFSERSFDGMTREQVKRELRR